MELLNLLRDPPREFTPIPFWFLNGELKDAEIRRQMKDFAAHGVYGVVLHPRIGLPKRIRYLSPTFFHYIKTAVQTAEELGMKIVLYDEGMYPSGSANGQVVKGHPELVSAGIQLTEAPGREDTVLCETDDGCLVVRPSHGTIRGIHWGQDDGELEAPASADILNPNAVARFIMLTHEAYYRELKQWFGTTIIGFFTDEPCILGRCCNEAALQSWTSGFENDFVAAGGDLRGLTALFRGEENKDTALYRKIILERERTVYYEALSNWCAEHNIALMGHPHKSDDIELEQYFHIPGQDLVLRWLGPEKDSLAGLDSTMAKCSADAARLMDRRRNSNECFGACNKDNNPWQFSGGDMKWYLDWLAVRGVNLFIPHAFYYSIKGKRRLGERPPDVGPNSLWWPWYEQWAAYMRRLSFLMTDAELHAPIAVLCRNRDLRPELVAPLFRKQIGFQYLPESVWNECTVQEGKLYCRGRRYQAVIGPEADRFVGVPHDAGSVTPDLCCEPEAPLLRCAKIVRCGVTCWLLVNEGEQNLQTQVRLFTDEKIAQYDLWHGSAARWHGTVTLPPRGSVLLFTCDAKTWEALPEPICYTNVCVPHFVETQHDPKTAKRVYTATLTLEDVPEHPALTLQADELVELTVNGTALPPSFWSPHSFDLTGIVHQGKNECILTVTGNLCNRYGRPIPYGLMTP